MAIKRTAPENLSQSLLTTEKVTYRLGNDTLKGTIAKTTPPVEHAAHSLKNDLLKTLAVTIIILVLIGVIWLRLR